MLFTYYKGGSEVGYRSLAAALTNRCGKNNYTKILNMRVLWTTNEDPLKKNSLVFLHSSMEGLKSHGIEVQLECIGSLKSPFALRRAHRHIRSMSDSFDIVHSQYGSACGLVTSLSTNKNKIITLRGSDWPASLSGDIKSKSHNLAAGVMTALSLCGYNKVITVSNRMADSIRRLYFAPPVTVLPSAINLDRFQIMNRQDARNAIGEGSDQRPWILFTSLLINNPVKRFQLAYEAFKIVNMRCGGTLRLKILSDIPHAMVPLHIAACDVILCTSKSEGWPNSVKEAMACGLPFVATDVSDLQEISLTVPLCTVRKATPIDLSNGLFEILRRTNSRLLNGPIIRRAVESMGTATSAAVLAKLYRSQINLTV